MYSPYFIDLSLSYSFHTIMFPVQLQIKQNPVNLLLLVNPLRAKLLSKKT